ncbi:putative HSP20-like chaperone, partial [Tanacetum coccineum]
RHPEIKWAQKEYKAYITVVLADTKDAKVNLAPKGVFSFSTTAGKQNKYWREKYILHFGESRAKMVE